MEVRTVRWSYLAEFDRKYKYHPPLPPSPRKAHSPSSGSPPKRSASSRRGTAPLPPMGWTARELFTLGRRFMLLLHPKGRPLLSQKFTVFRHDPLQLVFLGEHDPPLTYQASGRLNPGQLRRISWREAEAMIMEDKVRWFTSVPTRRYPRHLRGPARSSS